MEYLGVGRPVVDSPNAEKGITTPAMNINLSFYIEGIKNRTL